MRAMMRTRIAVLALAAGMSPALAAPIPVALVEEVSGAPAGVEFMDYVETGKTIELGARGGIVLSNLNSCVRETISGGTVKVGIVCARVAPPAPVREVPGGYLFLVADCALRSASSAHAIHAAAISINTALPFATLGPPDACILPRIGGSARRHSP
jgi:hypothetical protein